MDFNAELYEERDWKKMEGVSDRPEDYAYSILKYLRNLWFNFIINILYPIFNDLILNKNSYV